MRLKMTGFIADPEYFENEVAPHIDSEQIIYEGHVSHQHKKDLLHMPGLSCI